MSKEFTGEVIWHYTSSVLSILDSKCLWASHVSALDDLSEVKVGVSVMMAAFEELDLSGCDDDTKVRLHAFIEQVPRFPQRAFFVLSGCAKKDSLTAWREYARYKGGSFGFRQEDPMYLHADAGAVTKEAETYVTGWRPVLYSPDEQRKEAREAARYVLANIRDERACLRACVDVVLFCKLEDFAVEEEHRVVVAFHSPPPHWGNLIYLNPERTPIVKLVGGPAGRDGSFSDGWELPKFDHFVTAPVRKQYENLSQADIQRITDQGAFVIWGSNMPIWH